MHINLSIFIDPELLLLVAFAIDDFQMLPPAGSCIGLQRADRDLEVFAGVGWVKSAQTYHSYCGKQLLVGLRCA